MKHLVKAALASTRGSERTIHVHSCAYDGSIIADCDGLLLTLDISAGCLALQASGVLVSPDCNGNKVQAQSWTTKSQGSVASASCAGYVFRHCIAAFSNVKSVLGPAHIFSRPKYHLLYRVLDLTNKSADDAASLHYMRFQGCDQVATGCLCSLLMGRLR